MAVGLWLFGASADSKEAVKAVIPVTPVTPVLAVSFDQWLDEHFDKQFEERFEQRWEHAFEEAWDQSVSADLSEEMKERFKESFRERFMESFEGAWRERFGGEPINPVIESEESSFNEQRLEWRDTLKLEASADDLTRLAVSTVNGNVSIKGEAVETVYITAKRTVRATDLEQGATWRDKFHPVLSRKDGTLVIDTPYEKDGNSTPSYIKTAVMEYEIIAPHRFAVDAKTVNGNVSTEETEGEAVLKTVNGNIGLRSTDGVDGGVNGKTVNGNVSYEVDTLTARTTLETVNGNAVVTVRRAVNGGIRAKTLNGNTNVTLPGDASFNLSAKVGMHGSIKTDWGAPEKKRGGFGSNYSTDVNGGGDRIDLETFNGSVRVTRGN
ncbi:MAG: hypothetical protein O3A46_00810 [Candidatus Poribacteria bacterium]|nr:hypothetical protein [Candidatus Poribacteria bacterium]